MRDLEAIADYIALDNPEAARRLVGRVFESVERLTRFPTSGKRPPELARTNYREVIVVPCRIFYRIDGDAVFFLHVMRAERMLQHFMLEERDKIAKPGAG